MEPDSKKFGARARTSPPAGGIGMKEALGANALGGNDGERGWKRKEKLTCFASREE